MSDQRDEVIYDPDRLLSDVLEGQVHTHPLILNESLNHRQQKQTGYIF